MKKIIGLMTLLFLVVGLSGCGAKKETDTFSQEMSGAKFSIIVEHEGDKVTDVSAKMVLDNDTLSIVDKDTAEKVSDAFEKSSGLEDTEFKYTSKKTTITGKAPSDMIEDGGSYKDSVKELEKKGFEKE